jgi:hypothetical protein
MSVVEIPMRHGCVRTVADQSFLGFDGAAFKHADFDDGVTVRAARGIEEVLGSKREKPVCRLSVGKVKASTTQEWMMSESSSEWE